MVIVTNTIVKQDGGETKKGFYMDGYLMENLNGIPAFLERKFDIVGLITGHGHVGVGKSTMAFQVGYYSAWLIAGGRMKSHRDKETNKLIIDEIINPKREVRFNLEENVAFKPEELRDKAHKLFDKYGKNQVIVYDEAREGLDTRVMDGIHETMQDFFQKCRHMGHVVLLVQPNFFKFHEDYAVARSLFLIDCYLDNKKRRGFFNFYNETQKEWLYFLGKKRLGITQKYNAGPETFCGRYGSWMPFNFKEYDTLKKASYEKKSLNKQAKRWKSQRDAAFWLLKKQTELTSAFLSERISELTGIGITEESFRFSCDSVEAKLQKDIEDR
jgi:hypothetical protein